MKHYYRRGLLIFSYFLTLLITHSCEFIDYSPHQVLVPEDYQDLNRKNADKIRQLGLKETDTIRFALISDTQRYYDETEGAVKSINERTAQKGKKIDFVLHGGDISDFGLTEEFIWIHEILKDLKMPYMTVIGNHDCVANGKKIYTTMYGPYDHTMQVAGNRFVFLNTNFLEFDTPVPHLDFLENALRDSANYNNAFILSHVPPFDVDANRDKEAGFAGLVRDYKKVRLSIHGHKHNYDFQQPYEGKDDYLIIGSVSKKYYVVVTVIGKKVSHEVITF